MLWILRLTLVLFFLVMFVWRSNRAWAVGLITMALMVVLDAMRMRELIADAGFLSWVLGGMLAAGVFYSLTELLRSSGHVTREQIAIPSVEPSYNAPVSHAPAENSAVDRQMLFDQIRTHLGPDDIYDLIFDVGLNENDVVNPAQDMPQTIVRLMDEAAQHGQSGQLAMSVERILTPVPKENLPRVGMLSAETPPHLLRQHLIANHTLSSLDDLATQLGIDWQEMGSDAKKSRIRRLLLHLQRRNRLPDLLSALKA